MDICQAFFDQYLGKSGKLTKTHCACSVCIVLVGASATASDRVETLASGRVRRCCEMGLQRNKSRRIRSLMISKRTRSTLRFVQFTALLSIVEAGRADKHIMSSIGNGRMGMHHAYRHVAPMADIGRDSGASLDFAILYVALHLCCLYQF